MRNLSGRSHAAVKAQYEAHVARGGRVPDGVLVRKSYEEKRRKREARQAAREAAEKERAEMEALAASSDDDEGDAKV